MRRIRLVCHSESERCVEGRARFSNRPKSHPLEMFPGVIHEKADEELADTFPAVGGVDEYMTNSPDPRIVDVRVDVEPSYRTQAPITTHLGQQLAGQVEAVRTIEPFLDESGHQIVTLRGCCYLEPIDVRWQLGDDTYVCDHGSSL